MTTVPSPREVLTSIINTLSAFDPAQSAQTARQTTGTNRHASSIAGTPSTASSAANPLKLIPNSHRALLTTLHVLYPTTLLPALDLLDRRLVTRVKVASQAQCSPNDETDASHPQEPHPYEQPRTEQPSPTPLPPTGRLLNHSQSRHFHLVRSAQPQSTHHRRRRDNQASATNTSTTTSDTGASSAGGKLYVVRLDAWNCSCAAFAFSAFPPEQLRVPPQPARQDNDERQQRQQDPDPRGGDGGVNTSFLTRLRGEAREDGGGAAAAIDDEKEGRRCGYDILPAAAGRKGDENAREEFRGGAGVIDHEADWEFGGLSIDGVEGSGISGVPCCKHLLACLLGERWSSILGNFIEERAVGREEAAGLMSET